MPGVDIKFALSLTGADMPALFRQAVDTRFAGEGLPDALLMSLKTTAKRVLEPGEDWFERYLPQPVRSRRPSSLTALWRYQDMAREGMVSWRVRDPVKLSRLGVRADVDTAFRLLRALDFRVCGSGPANMQWIRNPVLEEKYVYGFSNAHFGHGWMCAFRGEGHDSLVSRRWLRYGPWKLLRDEAHDISLVLFHDPDEADPAVTIDQAFAGHRRMGNSNTGGFIREGSDKQGNFHATGGYRYRNDLRGIYVAEDRTFRIVVAGRDVPQREMLDACAYRLHQRDDPEQPIANVAYVFVEEERARAHLHELWLRGLECRAIIRGEEVRLDLDYDPPPPEPPAWVRAWDARHG